VLKALKELGGSGRPAEVVEIVARLKKASDAERQETLKSGALRFDKEVAFARKYLVWAGYVDASKRGVWSLTEKGMAAKGLSDSDAHLLFKEQNALRGPLWKKGDETKEDGKEEESLEVQESYKESFLSILQNLPPALP
jgi:restriction system protein